MEKNLYRDMNNKMICGVAAGLGKFFNIDPTIVRVAWAILSCFAGVGVLAYIVCAIIIPQEPVESF